MSLTHSFSSIALEGALQIAQATLAKGREAGMLPLAVAVLDPRGTLKAFLAEEGTSLYRFEIARGKALGAPDPPKIEIAAPIEFADRVIVSGKTSRSFL